MVDRDSPSGLRWAVNRRRARRGDVAGTRCARGYWRLSLSGKRVLAHRVVWLLTHDEDPGGMIDHIDGDPANNRIENLRLATYSQNLRNKRRGSGASRYMGVSWSAAKSKWVAQQVIDRRHHWIGQFACETAAALARDRWLHDRGERYAHYNLSAPDANRPPDPS